MELENLVWDLAKLNTEYIKAVREDKIAISPEMVRELRENAKFVIEYADSVFPK